MQSEKLTFTGHGGDTLAARLDRPAEPVRAVALFAHCFTCSKDIAAARNLSGRLTAAGWAVLRFDFTGLGHSQGEFANTGFRGNIGDLVAAAGRLAETVGAPQLLIGHSLGGAAVLAAAPRLDSVRAVATIGAPADPDHVLDNFGCDLDAIREHGEGEVTLGGRKFRVSREFVEDVEAATVTDALGSLHRALLILHAPRDMQVGIDNATRLFAAARHPKSFVSLDDADHLLTDAADAGYAANVIAAWAERYVTFAEEPADETPEGVVRVREADPEGFLQDIHAGGRHRLKADEPEEHGGTDRGPSPYQYVSAGLGACTAMTIRMYARRKEWALTHVAVDVSHDRIHAEDCADCETRSGRIDRFRRIIRLEGDLDEDQRTRLREIADKCPVHRTLENEIRIETDLA